MKIRSARHKARSTKSEIRNKWGKWRKFETKGLKHFLPKADPPSAENLEFVSNFDIRISNFTFKVD
ncbi:hypothetical protein COU12_00125 [Candidatus Jorgensenbacteria bacterium CG10_big_fil_rev_8_21_14_0_10_54_38]|uniref:Uncharacterized protein n=2 Tax=Candidatus Joergenseniibacteriota TaxID=1752739 RepID=A0A2M6WGR8_9BACT|nr:MAG: hypothetical protein COX26_00540 [Candidatus Jorgensenbacteria bacterium CG23_combo_of_CG06-09_8_20_14_all_54_14]PIT91967.1 MAG: hypothetical protein COU12_00125 [Candidatus Jorgensenbacteria bacterium CG10_big_fil_rev_8_21_14_0_10_54_38]